MNEPMPPSVESFLGNSAAPPPYAAPRRKRAWGGAIIGLVVVGAVVAGIAAVVMAVTKVTNTVDKAVDTAMNQSNELSNPDLSDNDRAALGLTGNEQTIFQGAASGAVAATFDNAIAGQPTMFLEMLFYPDYAFATAQNSSQTDHFDEYGWRTGTIGTPTPQQNDAEAATMVFSVDQVNWAAISALATQAVTLTKVENGAVTHVSVSRDTFSPDHPVVIRMYVSGPRSSAFIEADANGTVLNIF
jgi:hypothetical protein